MFGGGNASAQSQYGTVSISDVAAPASVVASRPEVGNYNKVTINITVSYDFAPNYDEILLVGVSPSADLAQTWPPSTYHALGYAGCWRPYFLAPAAECSPANSTISPAIGTTTVSFTLTAPSFLGTWQPVAFATIATWGQVEVGLGQYMGTTFLPVLSASKGIVITLIEQARTVPETSSVLALLIPALLLGLFVLRRRKMT